MRPHRQALFSEIFYQEQLLLWSVIHPGQPCRPNRHKDRVCVFAMLLIASWHAWHSHFEPSAAAVSDFDRASLDRKPNDVIARLYSCSFLKAYIALTARAVSFTALLSQSRRDGPTTVNTVTLARSSYDFATCKWSCHASQLRPDACAIKHCEEDYYICECICTGLIVRVPQTELLALAALRNPQREGNCGRRCAVNRKNTDKSDGAGN